MIFVEISEIMKRILRPKKKLVIAERSKFLSSKQKQDESIMQYHYILKGASRMISGMADIFHKHRILEQLQFSVLG